MEEIRCKTTFDGLESWLKSYMTTRGYQRYEIGRADDWRVESGAWAEGISYIGPSKHAEVRIRITTLEPELIEVTGEVASNPNQETIDPRDQVELETVLDAIRVRWVEPPKPAEDAPKLPGRATERQEWIVRWEKIKPLVEDAKPISAIQTWLDAHEPHLWASEETLRKNIAWGQAGAKT